MILQLFSADIIEIPGMFHSSILEIFLFPIMIIGPLVGVPTYYTRDVDLHVLRV